MLGILKKIFKIKHKHQWQCRARSRWGNETYRVCLKCGIAQSWQGGTNGEFKDCERIEVFDKQFDDKNNFIF